MDDLVGTTGLTPPNDGFYSDDGRSGGGGAEYIKFDGSTQSHWFNRTTGSILEKLGPYAVPFIRIVINKWVDKRNEGRIVQTPGEPFPDVVELNEKAPKSEWAEDFNGNPIGPYSTAWEVFFADLVTGSKLVGSAGSIGWQIAYNNLKERTIFMRNLRGEQVIPIVELSDKNMRTRFGMKVRPDFKILDWHNFGSAPAIAAPSALVVPLTSAEIIDDQLPEHPVPQADPLIGKVRPSRKRPASMPVDPNDNIGF